MRGTKWLAFGAGLTLAACVTTQQVQVTLSPAPAAAQWQGAWGGSIGGGVTALPGGGLTFPAGQILAPDGSAAAPSYSWASAPTVGSYLSGAVLYLQNPGGGITFTAGGASWGVNTVGNFYPATGDNLYDLGHPALRPRTLFVSTSLNATARTAPATPAAGTGILYYSSVDKKFHQINDAGLDTALW